MAEIIWERGGTKYSVTYPERVSTNVTYESIPREQTQQADNEATEESSTTELQTTDEATTETTTQRRSRRR